MFQFTLTRLLLVVALFCVLFAWMRPYGTAGLVTAAVAGTALGGLTVLATRKNLGTIVSAFIWGFTGAFVSGMCCDPGIRSGTHESQAMDDVSRVVVGAFLGWFLGFFVRLTGLESGLIYGHRHEHHDTTTFGNSSHETSKLIANESTPSKDHPTSNA